jgi:hypothetical protein
MPKPLPFTEASLSRAIKGVQKAGLFVIGVRPADGTLIVADKPIDPTSIVPPDAQPSFPEAAEGRRMGDYFHGGSGEA